MNGYCHPEYARSLSEFGQPYHLPGCGGWILDRPIPGFPDRDSMGCYPLFCCDNWSQLPTDLENIETDVVSLALVPDPFGEYDEAYLHHCFPDVVMPYKEHFVIDLRQNSTTSVSSHHRYCARRALKDVRVEVCSQPLQFLDDWCQLYHSLVERHHLQGIKAFSYEAFARQLAIPGLVMFRAIAQDTTVGAYLWLPGGEVAYAHLGASSPLTNYWTVTRELTCSIGPCARPPAQGARLPPSKSDQPSDRQEESPPTPPLQPPALPTWR
ncbi:MAG: hypothetical protein EXR62_09665 [Chloroflexi bacterium]|nr:hypothetical protein [Chloroflexota bacterium]